MASVTDISKMITELYELIVSYIKGQTIVPLKRLIRYLSFGIGGSIFIAMGLLLVNLGLLRALQSMSAFESTYSFAPYLIVAVVDIAGIGILFALITRKGLIGEK